MGGTARLNPFTVEFCERRIEQLRSEKTKLLKKLTNLFTELADRKGRKKTRFKQALVRKIKRPETRKKLVEQAGLEDAKKHASEIDYAEETIKFMQKRKKYIILRATTSLSPSAAMELVEQEEKLKDEKKHKVKAKPDLDAATSNLPTLTHGCKDPATVAAVVDPDDKMKVINVAKAIVNISYPIDIQDLDDLDGCCTGIIVAWDMDNQRAKILTCGCFGYGGDDNNKSNKIYVRWQYKEDDGLIEAKLLFFSNFYQLSLLEVAFKGTLLDIPTQIPHFCLSPPKHGDEVFTLGRDKDLSLAVRRGTIMREEQGFHAMLQGYLFVGCELPECGTGGPVVNHHGDVVGLSIPCTEGMSAILPISTALSCLDMWTEFRRIARPLIGMRLRNVEVLDGASGDIRFDGLVVDEVEYDSAAWNLGIRSGNVIVSFDEKPPKPLPEFEGFLLSYGPKYIHGTYTEVDFKLEVQDAPDVKRSITLHVPFSDVANVKFSDLLERGMF